MSGWEASGFEWDETKRRSNLAKHGIDFLDARQIFDGRLVLETKSPYTEEERFVTVGPLNERYVTVVWTPRQENVRIISARYARRMEIRAYLARPESVAG
jgi:uncharacterized DUF497 family protein